MDSRHQNHDQPAQSAIRENYPFSSAQNDGFNSFLHTENESAFNNPWESETFSDPQEPINGFNPNHSWNANTMQQPNYLSVSNYGVQPRLDQTFSAGPSFNYAGFDPRSNLTMPSPSFDPSLSYAHMPLNDDSSFTFASRQGFPTATKPSETISPQALQNYPATSTPGHISESRPSQKYSSQPTSSLGKTSVGGPPNQAPVTGLDWRSISSAIPKGIPNGGFVTRTPADLAIATNSKKFKGFVFVGNSNVELSSTKATLPKYNLRISKNEVWKSLLQEKGNGPWSAARGPLLKKLKKSPVHTSGPKPFASSAASQGLSTLESASSPESDSQSESDEDSDYSSESDEDVEPEELSPLPPSRPADLLKATEYDTLKAVWAPRNRTLTVSAIRTALAEYWNIIKGIRDKWKSELTTLQQAELKKDTSKITNLISTVNQQRRLMKSCIRLTLDYGHQDIIEKLGENPILSVVFFQFLQDRFKENEYSGPFIASIVELMTRCTTLDQAVLEKTKVDKVLQRLIKKGDNEGKKYAQKVLDNAAAVTKQKAIDNKLLYTNDTKEKQTQNVSGIKPSLDSSRIFDSNNDIKKQKTSELAAGQSPNKQLSTASHGVNTTASSKSIGLLGKRQQTSKTDLKTTTKSNASAVPVSKVKTNHISAKPSGFFSSLQSASKKPGTSNASQLSAKSKEGKESAPSENKTPVTIVPPKPAFSFAETMANLNKQKEAPPLKSEDNRPPETPEEKAKRLRKEERRKLRVSFKPDDSLVEVRTFVHDPEEEMGHDDSMMRDVGDSRGEGQMLKMHKDLDLMDDDEDGIPLEQSFAPWKTPSLIDFSVIEPDELGRNYTSKGGKKEFESKERAIQEQRELNYLMAIYNTPLEIPPTPREPSDPFAGETAIEQSFGDPSDETKGREAHYYGRQNPHFYSSINLPMTTQAPIPDIAALLQIINGQKPVQLQPPPPPPPPPPPQPQPTQQSSSIGLEAIFAQFSTNNVQQAPPMQIPQPPQPVAAGIDLQAALAAFNLPTQAQSTYVPPPQVPTPDLQAILSQFTRQQQPPVQTQNYGYGNIYQAENDRKRQLDYDDQANNEYGYSKGKRQKADGKKKFYGVPRLPCKFWQEGKCKKGDDCTFLHE